LSSKEDGVRADRDRSRLSRQRATTRCGPPTFGIQGDSASVDTSDESGRPIHQSTRKMKRKIIFAGIDGAGKSTSLDLLISKLDPKYKILKIGFSNSYLFFRGERNTALRYDVQGAMEPIGQFSKKYHCYRVFLVFKFFVKKVITKYLEMFKRCDLIMYETDTLLHPAVHVTFHFPWSKSISQKSRLRIASALFGSKRKLIIVFLDADPSITIERIRSRGDPIDAHENTEDLVVLRREFHKMLAVAAESGISIIKINTENKPPEQVVNEIGEALEASWLTIGGESG
jgi:thymidylate kinase